MKKWLCNNCAADIRKKRGEFEQLTVARLTEGECDHCGEDELEPGEMVCVREDAFNAWVSDGTLPKILTQDDPEAKPDWDTPCECGAVPTLPLTGMCGPCTFGEAETAGGNW